MYKTKNTITSNTKRCGLALRVIFTPFIRYLFAKNKQHRQHHLAIEKKVTCTGIRAGVSTGALGFYAGQIIISIFFKCHDIRRSSRAKRLNKERIKRSRSRRCSVQLSMITTVSFRTGGGTVRSTLIICKFVQILLISL